MDPESVAARARARTLKYGLIPCAPTKSKPRRASGPRHKSPERLEEECEPTKSKPRRAAGRLRDPIVWVERVVPLDEAASLVKLELMDDDIFTPRAKDRTSKVILRTFSGSQP